MIPSELPGKIPKALLGGVPRENAGGNSKKISFADSEFVKTPEVKLTTASSSSSWRNYRNYSKRINYSSPRT